MAQAYAHWIASEASSEPTSNYIDSFSVVYRVARSANAAIDAVHPVFLTAAGMADHVGTARRIVRQS
jgi:hypothetical protein